MNNSTLYLSVIKKNRFMFISIFMTLTIVLFLITVLMTIQSYHRYYHDMKYGFIPGVVVRLNSEVAKSDMEKLVDDLSRGFGLDLLHMGGIFHAPDCLFKFNDGEKAETIARKTSFLGIDFPDTHGILLNQGKKSVQCRVKNFVKFGQWFMTLECAGGTLNSGPAQWIRNKDAVGTRIRGNGKKVRMILDIEDEKTRRFILSFLGPCMAAHYSGIEINGFRVNPDAFNDNRSFYHEFPASFVKAYASVVFPSNGSGKIPVLLSAATMKQVNKYGGLISTELVLGKHTFPVQVLEKFQFSPDHFFPKNAVVMDMKNFMKVTGGGYNALFLYGSNANVSKIKRVVASRYPGAKIHPKEDLVSNFKTEKRLVKFGVYLMVGLIFCVGVCISLVRLLKFYTIFRKDIVLLKLYGFKKSIFSRIVMGLFVVGLAVDTVLLHLFFKYNNRLLSDFFYPPIHLGFFQLSVAAGMGALMMGVLAGVEKKTFRGIGFKSNEG